MIAGRLVVAAAMAALFTPVAADARRYNNDKWEDRWENRRDARRAGIVAGAVAGSIAASSARANAEQRFEECLLYNGYDYECERRRYDEEMRARRAGRRSALVVGGIAREIVRD